MKNLKFIISILIIAWIVEIIDQFTGISLDALGIRPRTISGLIGVPLMPFLHGGWGHIINNTISLAIMGVIASTLDSKNFKTVTAFIILLGGILIWIAGRNAIHVGASALIYGYFGYIIAACIVLKNWQAVLYGAIIIYAQLSMFAGMLPFTTSNNVSWEGHLFGAISGAVVGCFIVKPIKK